MEGYDAAGTGQQSLGQREMSALRYRRPAQASSINFKDRAFESRYITGTLLYGIYTSAEVVMIVMNCWSQRKISRRLTLLFEDHQSLRLLPSVNKSLTTICPDVALCIFSQLLGCFDSLTSM